MHPEGRFLSTTANQKIVASAIAAANGKILGLPTRGGWCLQFVRMVVEHAMGWPSHEFYARYLVAGTSRRGNTPEQNLREAKAGPWASDFEASAKKLGWPVPGLLRKPGDLVFNYRAAAPVGHVGILLTRDMVIENIRPDYRKQSIHLPNSISITPYASLPWTLVARVPSS